MTNNLKEIVENVRDYGGGEPNTCQMILDILEEKDDG